MIWVGRIIYPRINGSLAIGALYPQKRKGAIGYFLLIGNMAGLEEFLFPQPAIR